jgi:hypothetical protein
MARYDGTRWGMPMVNPGRCRGNANNCIEMANDSADPEARERLFGLALAWLEIAGDLEREDAEHEELLRTLARHFRPVRVFPTH